MTGNQCHDSTTQSQLLTVASLHLCLVGGSGDVLSIIRDVSDKNRHTIQQNVPTDKYLKIQDSVQLLKLKFV